jgi:hypothetical protein
MLPSQSEWINMYPHRILIQQVLMDMVKATQCPHCNLNHLDYIIPYGNQFIYKWNSDDLDSIRPSCINYSVYSKLK